MSRGEAGKGRPPDIAEFGGEAFDSPYVKRILTRDARLMRLLAQLPLYARAELSVLILGEPGTGKELVAEALWAFSPRVRQPFLRLNCANLGADLAGSELFGHLKGAFTGADQSRSGKFKAAHRGTLFLDEVGDLPLGVQPRLLRALEQGEIEPLGGDAPLRVDVRLIAATNQDIPGLIAAGRFRQDVYDRLAVLVLELPPLRERGEDVLFLAERFLEEEAGRYRRRLQGFSPAARRRLREHPWTGNVRELRNVITRAVIFSAGPWIQEGDLYFAPTAPGTQIAMDPDGDAILPRPGRRELEECLREEGGNVSAAARRFKVCTRTVYRWLKSCGIDLEDARAASGQWPVARSQWPLARKTKNQKPNLPAGS
jgi:two-component system, NtrC family, response regulator HydG